MLHSVLARSALPPLCAAFLAGCSERASAPALEKSIPLDVGLDLVFVVDNSGSMLAEQHHLAASFPEFVDALQRIRGDLPDLHLGVLSSNA